MTYSIIICHHIPTGTLSWYAVGSGLSKKKKKMPLVARLTQNKLTMLIIFHMLPYSQVYCISNSYYVQIEIYMRGSVHAGKHWQACNKVI